MLWVGWFGFNAGSELAADGIAASAFCATHFAAAAGALAWAGMEWITRGKPSVLGACSGAVAGLVCITPASGFVQPMPAIVMGVAAGMVCFFACTKLKIDVRLRRLARRLRRARRRRHAGRDPDRRVRHACTSAIRVVSDGQPVGLIEGGTDCSSASSSAVVRDLGLRGRGHVHPPQGARRDDGPARRKQDRRCKGLDLSQHGEEGYIFL